MPAVGNAAHEYKIGPAVAQPKSNFIRSKTQSEYDISSSNYLANRTGGGSEGKGKN